MREFALASHWFLRTLDFYRGTTIHIYWLRVSILFVVLVGAVLVLRKKR